MSLKPGDVVKQKGPTGKAIGHAMCVEGRYTGIVSSPCWTCTWFVGGEVKRRAFLESVLLPVASPVQAPCDSEVPA